VFFFARENGHSLEAARTMVVNMLVAAEIFYLFNVRYLHGGSISLHGVLGTRAVLMAVAAVTMAQLAFTYAPFMNAVFESRPLSVLELVAIVGLGVLLMVLLEGEKLLVRRFGWFGADEERARARP
jgi:magnesium-transporting ATPase (P-type)